MYKKIGLWSFITVIMSISSVQTVTAQDMIAVDARYVVAESDEMKRALAEVETMKKAMEKELTNLEQDLEGKSESLKRKRTILSQEQLMEEEGNLKAKLREYRTKGENMNEKLSNEVTIRRKKVIKALNKVINDYAEKNEVDVVVDSSSLLYGKKSIDKTEKILERLNKHFEEN